MGVRVRRRTVLADALPDRDRHPGVAPVLVFWTTAGAVVVMVGGLSLLVLWLTPGVPPPGPLG